LRLGLLAAVLPALICAPALARDMQPPRLTSAQVDWSQALASLADVDVLRVAALETNRRMVRSNRAIPPVLARLNATVASRFPGAAGSPIPVLLPFDTAALMRDQSAGTFTDDNRPYLSGFQGASFFYPGPSGYDAIFTTRPADVAELSDIKSPDTVAVLISGSVLLYELDDPNPIVGTAVPDLEADFPGIRRLMHEHHLRYTFVRFGVPYVVSTPCFSGSAQRKRLPTCAAADRILVRTLRALRVVGGTPQSTRKVQPLAIERPREMSAAFRYHPPGRLLKGTGFRGQGGRTDETVYAQIRFPLADAPAYVNSQMFQSRNKSADPDHKTSPNHDYPWRDNFCERRAFSVGQCPFGSGHQGQDIRTAPCQPEPGADKCVRRDDLVAVRDGAILRAPGQEALYLVVNTETEHIRFRYLHMNPHKMDEDRILSGRQVNEGEVIGQVGNYHRREGGTSRHLHFDVQVPTRHGWVFVNPYMTLVAAYERLIRARGEAVAEPFATEPAAAEPAATELVAIEPGGAEPTAAPVDIVAPKTDLTASSKQRAAKKTWQSKHKKSVSKPANKHAKKQTRKRYVGIRFEFRRPMSHQPELGIE